MFIYKNNNKKIKFKGTAMKEYTKQMFLFTDIFGKRVEVDFDGGEMTSDAGILYSSGNGE